MNKKLAIFLSIIIFVFGYSAYQAIKLDSKLSESSPFQSTEILKTLPAASFSVEGEAELYDVVREFAGYELLIVHFWATWCLPCVKEFPEFIAFSKSIESLKKVKILAVSVDDKAGDVKKFFNKHSITSLGPIITVDDRKGAHKLFGSYKLPETFIFSADGKLLRKLSGAQNWLDSSFTEFIKSI